MWHEVGTAAAVTDNLVGVSGIATAAATPGELEVVSHARIADTKSSACAASTELALLDAATTAELLEPPTSPFGAATAAACSTL